MFIKLPWDILQYLKEQQQRKGGSYASLIIDILRDAMKANDTK